jgi:hypothetical protein
LQQSKNIRCSIKANSPPVYGKTSKEKADRWAETDFNDSAWPATRELLPFGGQHCQNVDRRRAVGNDGGHVETLLFAG